MSKLAFGIWMQQFLRRKVHQRTESLDRYCDALIQSLIIVIIIIIIGSMFYQYSPPLKQFLQYESQQKMLKMRKRMGLRTRTSLSTRMQLSQHMSCLAWLLSLLSSAPPCVPGSVLQCSVFGPPLTDLSRGRTLALASSLASAPATSYSHLNK